MSAFSSIHWERRVIPLLIDLIGAGTKGGLTCLTGGHLFKIHTVCMERNDG